MVDLRWSKALSGLFFVFLFSGLSLASERPPVFIGLDAEFGHRTSTSAQAIQQGIEIAIEEINAAGGVLGGRPLKLLVRDNRSIPARARANLLDLLKVPDLVAVFCGKFSPTVLEVLPLIREHKLIVLNPWAAADNIIDNGYDPNYVFRLSLRDRWAIASLLGHAENRGFRRVGFLLPNTSWGRSNQGAIETYLSESARIHSVGIHWFNWDEKPLAPKYRSLAQAGAEAIVLVANEGEGAQLIKEVAQLPKTEQRPILAHWGVTGGDLAALAGEALWRLNAQALGDDGDLRPHNELFLRRLLYDRNERMAERLAPLIAQGSVFAAFGALHLYGERGVPTLLARRGFSVEVLY
ncbi:MAG: hypothetical protein KatS3mg123_0229 [Burkholderiales bacterium]|nr:MAG: hypothetical protein KatS3mg123_0229 [Burkholderiales bacterium]